MSAGYVVILYDMQTSQISGIVKADVDKQYDHHRPKANERRLTIPWAIYATLHSYDDILNYLGLAKPPPPPIAQPLIVQPIVELP